MLINVVLFWQVTIVTNNVPAVGGESGETRCQGDMEKADMVDGKKQMVCSSSQLDSHQSPLFRCSPPLALKTHQCVTHTASQYCRS